MPNSEEVGQISARDMQVLAAAHGMAFAHVPTSEGKITDEGVAGMVGRHLAALHPPLETRRVSVADRDAA